eukprot:6179553-Pleurochrysis_carterae.AAC.1
MLLQQGSRLDTTVPQSHGISNLDPYHRIHSVGLEPTTMSIEMSSCIEQKYTLRGLANCLPRLPVASGERRDRVSTVEIDERRHAGGQMLGTIQSACHHGKRVRPIAKLPSVTYQLASDSRFDCSAMLLAESGACSGRMGLLLRSSSSSGTIGATASAEAAALGTLSLEGATTFVATRTSSCKAIFQSKWLMRTPPSSHCTTRSLRKGYLRSLSRENSGKS